MTQENKRTPKVGDYVRTTKAVGPFDKGALLRIYEIERPTISGSTIYHALCERGYGYPPIGTTCFMFYDDFVVEEENGEESPVTKEDMEERIREIYSQMRDLNNERKTLEERLDWIEKHEEYEETKRTVLSLLETSKDERTLVDSISDFIKRKQSPTKNQ